jgi:hypothetical protein
MQNSKKDDYFSGMVKNGEEEIFSDRCKKVKFCSRKDDY